MNINDLMEALSCLNVTLELKNGELLVKAPQGALTTELKLSLKSHKQTLIEILSEANVGEAEDFQIIPDKENIYEPFPLADLQEAFYMADNTFMEFQVRPHYYCEQDLDDVDIARYEFAMNKALRRHKGEAVMITPDKQLQVIENIPYVACKINDLTSLSFEDAQINLLSLRQDYMRKELPLNRWPWFEIEISIWIENGKKKYRVHSNQNNFYTDGFGATLIQREIDALYENITLDLPPLELSFRDAVLGLRKLADTPEGKKAKDYWLSRLPNLPAPPSLPLVHGMNRRCRSKLQRRGRSLTAEQWTQFKNNAGQFGVTPTSAIITAYAETLSRWSGSRHFILSNMVTRRLPIHPQIRNLVGNFASLYPLEIDLRSDNSFYEKALRIQQQILRDSDHRQWGGMQVMQAFNRMKGEFGSVPCPFVVGSALFMGGYRKPDFSCLETSQTMLDHQFWEIEDGSLYYAWDLLEEFFPPNMINSMWDAHYQLLQNLAGEISSWKYESTQIAPDFSARFEDKPTKAISGNKLIHRNILDKHICKDEFVAIVSNDSEITYRQIREQIAAVNEAITSYAISPNELIALLMDRDHYLFSSTLAVLCAGGAYVPLDPKLPNDRINYLLENTEAKVVLTTTKYSKEFVWPDKVTIICVDALPPISKNIHQKEVSANDLAYVIYTSGSTGSPKGVMIDHLGASNTIQSINALFSVNENDLFFGVSSFNFDLSVYDIFGAIAAGATLVYPNPDSAFNPSHWVSLINEKQITIWNSAPPLMSLLVETSIRQNVTFPSLRLVLLSGDWIPVELPALIRKIAPSAKIISLGGATEASIWSIYYPIEKVDSNWLSIPYGKALPNQGWKICDSLRREVPVWTTGDLYITGIGLAKGYWKDSEKTKSSFIFSSSTGEYLYKTGDMGRYLPDGNIEFLGRCDNQVKIQGHRIELGEIESALKAISVVRESVVLAVAQIDESNSDQKSAKSKPSKDKKLVAYLILDKSLSEEIDTSEIISQLKHRLAEKLPSYMVPSGWAFLDSLPITSNGKIDRKALEKCELMQTEKSQSLHKLMPPKTDLEQKLVEIWEGITNKKLVGVNCDIFDEGGNSFDAVRSLSVIYEHSGVMLSLGDIWETRTIENIAARITALSEGKSKDLFVALNKFNSNNAFHFLPPGGGQVIGYYPLAEQLKITCYALPLYLDEIETHHLADMEKLAAFSLKKIREAQKRGPYSIVGWSSGGAVAFEVAAQLEEQGHLVEQLIMLDAPSPMQHEKISTLDMLKGFFEDLGLNLPIQEIDRCFNPQDALEVNFTTIVALFNQSLKASGTNATLDAEQLFSIYKIFDIQVCAIRNYTPKPIKANITVIRALEGTVTEFAGHPRNSSPDWGWSEFTTGSVFSHSVPGSHHTFLRSPNVIHVAKILNNLINAHAKPTNTQQLEALN